MKKYILLFFMLVLLFSYGCGGKSIKTAKEMNNNINKELNKQVGELDDILDEFNNELLP